MSVISFSVTALISKNSPLGTNNLINTGDLGNVPEFGVVWRIVHLDFWNLNYFMFVFVNEVELNMGRMEIFRVQNFSEQAVISFLFLLIPKYI